MFSYFDTHCDTACHGERDGVHMRQNGGHVDFERLSKFDRAVQCFSMFHKLALAPAEGMFHMAQRQAKYFHEELAANADIAVQCRSAEDIRKAHDVANPGCFATAIQLATLPLAAAGLINDEVHVTAITGSTGAGKKPGETTHFSYRNDNISIYKLFSHQHLAEIKKNIVKVGSLEAEPKVNFVPLRGDFARGIFASVYTKAAEGLTLEDYQKIYEDYYASSPFVFLSKENISMKEVVNTNKALLHVELHDGYIHIASAIDNLIKGASGQAVQNMNLMFGLPEDTGLRLKPSAF
jgi:N-acetyl-gamma-glutamyl-phosphate reductase